MIVIGVTGFVRSGKNSTTTILGRYGFKHYAFAESLREMARAVNPVVSLKDAPEDLRQRMSRSSIDAEEQYSYEYRYTKLIAELTYEQAKDIPDFRRFLQRLGTDGIRATFGPNAWVNALARKVSLDKPERVAVSDVRFQSEADWIHAQGGLLWRVIRPGVGGNDPHPSEVEMTTLRVDREITATTLDELERAVIDAVAADLPLFPPAALPSSTGTPDNASTRSLVPDERIEPTPTP